MKVHTDSWLLSYLKVKRTFGHIGFCSEANVKYLLTASPEFIVIHINSALIARALWHTQLDLD